VCQSTYTLIMTDFDGHEELIMSESKQCQRLVISFESKSNMMYVLYESYMLEERCNGLLQIVYNSNMLFPHEI